jgi:hypothetical protein
MELTKGILIAGMTTIRLACAAVAAIATVAIGCGGDDNNAGDSPAKRQSRPATVPAELLGSYATTLRRADLPHNPPPELTDGSRTWKLTIAKSGSIGNGPALTIANDELGVLESSNFVAEQGTLVLRKEECAAGGTEHFSDNKYRYALASDRLRFSTISNSCADKVAETILTGRPWSRIR